VLGLLAVKQFGDSPQGAMRHGGPGALTYFPPFTNGFGSEQVQLGQAVHLWMLAEHGAHDRCERTRCSEDEKRTLRRVAMSGQSGRLLLATANGTINRVMVRKTLHAHFSACLSLKIEAAPSSVFPPLAGVGAPSRSAVAAPR
jgi:hypothetical protein